MADQFQSVYSRLNSGTWARSRVAELQTANLPGGRPMRVAVRHVPGLLVALSLSLLAVPALAQFGHPLKGTWSGDWGASKDSRTHVVLEMNWDGKQITGNINP